MKLKRTRKSTYILLAALLGGFLSTAFCAVDAQAQEILERFKTKLPVVEELEPSVFEEATVLYEETPSITKDGESGKDEVLSYSVRLPKTWEKVTHGSLSNYSVSNRVLGEVARYRGPPSLHARSRMTIEALDLEYQISAVQWFLQHVLSNGYTLQGMKVYDDRRVEGLLVMIENDTSYVVRVVARINGKRMILAKYYMEDSQWAVEQGMQAAAMRSFKLNSDKVEIIEDMALFQFLDIAEFKYPKSWKLRAPPLRSIDRMSVSLSNLTRGRTLNGLMELYLVSSFVSETLPDEIERFKKQLEEKGLVFGEKLEKREGYKFNESMEFGLVDVYTATDAKNKVLEYEIWLTMMSSGGYYYFLTLLTPGRDEDFFVWSRNTETYKLVIESVAPLEESLLDE
ncbi:MAG: hypothetical protein DHS20C02_06920 [Micavibrio sp.]|nr:MAG: hypothetical protein DHS20C02_06920 [Micavibrio sp.]